MELNQAIQQVNSRFKYKADPEFIFDVWKVMDEDTQGVLLGDCEDYSLTVLWFANDCSYWKFFKNVILLHKYKLHHVITHTGERHIVGSYNNQYFDNWTLVALSEDDFFKSTKHDYQYQYFIPSMVLALLTGFFYKMK